MIKKHDQHEEDKIALNILKQQAIKLKYGIKRNSKKIENPALVTSIVSELDFFIDNLMDRPE